MGNFVHHLSGGLVAGAVAGAAANVVYGADPLDSTAVGVICLVGSLLPDIDSGQSKPHEMMFGIASVLVPIYAIQAFDVSSMTATAMILIALAGYLAVRYPLRALFERVTVHRGIFHSIPMAILWGTLTYLALRHAPPLLKNLAGAAATLGYFVHLLIDEMFSFVGFGGESLSPKQSFGTAIKFFSGTSLPVNIATYAVVIYLMYLCVIDAGIIRE